VNAIYFNIIDLLKIRIPINQSMNKSNRFRLSRSSLIFEFLPFGLKDRGLLIIILPDVSPASVAGIFRGLNSEQQPRSRRVLMPHSQGLFNNPYHEPNQSIFSYRLLIL
jgi:hypothetical protein